MRFTNLDAAESMFLERQLTHLRSRIYEVRYPELQARQLIPASPDPAQDGDSKVNYVQEDSFGEAKVVSDYATDLPLVNMKREEFSQKIVDLGIAFQYSLSEVRKAARIGMDLSAKLGLKARKASETKLDEILSSGDSANGLEGFLNHSDVNADNVADGAGDADLTWATKTADEILADINEPVSMIIDQTKGIWGQSLRVLLPHDQYTLIAQKARSSTSDMTILQFLLKSSPFIKDVRPWWRCKAAGDSATDRMVVYQPDPDVVNCEVPAEFEILNPQERGLQIYVPTRLATGGVIVHQPKAIEYRDGI